MVSYIQPKKYEEYVYVLDFIPNGKSITVKGRTGPLIQSIGEDMLILLEILAMNNVKFTVGERVSIGKDSRVKIISVLGRLTYNDLTPMAKNELLNVITKIILNNEYKFVDYFNKLQPITPRLHALELIPGIGKTTLREILKNRETKPFESFDDIQKRIKLKEPWKLLAERILEEIKGNAKINILVKRI
ncbi:MAG: DUF655 domain-containing protein [Nitrososphaerales archaeon]